MEYRIAQNFEPDKILKWKIRKNEKIKIPIQKDIGKEKQKIVGYLTHKLVDESEEYDDFLKVKDKCILINKKKPILSATIGYISVSDTEIIEVRKSMLFFILFFFVLIVVIYSSALFDIPEFIPEIPQTDISNPNQVNSGDIPEYQEEDKVEPSVWISGSSTSKVNSEYKNIYLTNDKDNTGYYMVYEVYSEDNTLLYKTGYIEAGAAEPFNAYDCKDLKTGENPIHYEVYFYDSNLFCVASSTVNGLTLIKN